jgi:hypothetical protein
MKVKTKRDEWSWLWHVMDSETRFMVANLVTKKREGAGCSRAAQRGKRSAET